MLKVPEPTQGPELAAKTRGRTALRRLTVGALAVLLALACVAAALAWQITHAGISLDFLQSSLSSTIQARLPADSSVTIGSTGVSYRGDQGLMLQARDVKVTLPNMATIALAQLSTVTTASAVLGRRIDFDSVSIRGAAIDIAAPLALERGGAPADIARSAAKAFIDQVLQTDNLIRGAGLEEVLVRDGTIRLSDNQGAVGPALRIAEANWAPFGADRSKVWLQVIEDNGAGWNLTIDRQVGSEGGAAVNLKIENLPMEALDPDFADSEGRDAFHEAAVSLQARAVSGSDGRFRGVRGVLSTGGGPLSFTGIDRIEVVSTAVSFALPPEGDRIAIPGGEIRTLTGNIRFDAVLDLGDAEGATLTASVQGGLLPTIGPDADVEVTGGELLARVDVSTQTVEVERFRLAAAEGSVSAIGAARFSGPDAGVEFALSLTEIPATVARAFWPPFVADKTRKWFDENVRSGTVGPTTLKVALPRDHIGVRGRDRVLPEGALSGTLPFRDAVFSPATIFPPLRDAWGDVYFADATATILMQNGLIEVEGRGDLQAAGTILVIPELGKPRLWGDLHLQLEGPAAALAALSDVPPLLVASKRDIRPDTLSGNAQLSLDGTIPLFEGGLLDAKPSFRLALTDFSSTAPMKDRLIGDADIVLDGTEQSFTVKGEANLDGLRASVDLVLGSGATSQTDVMVSLDDAARNRLGLALGGMLKGPVQATIKQSGDGTQQIGLDLAQARISLPALGWEKGPGVAATAEFVLAKSEAGTRVTDLVLVGKGFRARGELSITPDGKLRDLVLNEFALRPGDQLSVTAAAKNGGYDVGIRGRALDARGIIRGIGTDSGGSADSDMFPLRVALDIEAVSGENNVVLSKVKGTATITAKGLDTVSLEGAANRTERFEWKLGKDGGARTLAVRANNGGALIRFAGLYRKIADGSLVLEYRGTRGGAGTGVLMMRDFHLQDETALAPAVESARQAAARSREGPAPGQNSGDLHFTQLRIPFRQDRWVISIDDAALRGPMLGATATGTVNVPGKRMALSGTLIPAFGLNNIAGAIPIIGTILGGGRDEGLVGITYKLFGPIDGPQLVMNPISAIAPGIFRKIFEYR